MTEVNEVILGKKKSHKCHCKPIPDEIDNDHGIYKLLILKAGSKTFQKWHNGELCWTEENHRRPLNAIYQETRKEIENAKLRERAVVVAITIVVCALASSAVFLIFKMVEDSSKVRDKKVELAEKQISLAPKPQIQNQKLRIKENH